MNDISVLLPPPLMVSLPAPPMKTLSPALPESRLSPASPVALRFAVPVRITFSMFVPATL